MRVASLALILTGGFLLGFEILGEDLNFKGRFNGESIIAASTIFVTGMILFLLSFVKRGAALDEPPTDDSND